MIRIAVGRFQAPLTVSGENLVVTGADGKRLRIRGPVVLAPSSKGILLRGKEIENQIVHVKSRGTVSLRGHDYHNHLEVSWRSYRGRPELLVVHPLPLETYVLGVVSSELPRTWPLEALKAQAIAARTYAIWQKYRRLELPYHMQSSVLDQVYHGAQREHKDARRAVAETYGQVMTFKRRPVQAYFHAACGDRTESAKEGWGTSLPYLPGSKCGFCKKANRYAWKAKFSRKQVNQKFRKVLGEDIRDMKVLSRSKSGRIKSVRLTGKSRKKVVKGSDVRRLLGYTAMWSTKVLSFKFSTAGLRIEGRGAGHGVGMCQWGAKGMAEKKMTVYAILELYYPGAKLSRLY
ncbi:MAG: SpoIID/LytB domain-containing protein [Deltaproteobacteria bacterium]|nr:SpoIID/LytB domain-containing protein [Deltaproteobacteria bacterium]